jgi:hypothetical protein
MVLNTGLGNDIGAESACGRAATYLSRFGNQRSAYAINQCNPICTSPLRRVAGRGRYLALSLWSLS